jgi:hypothetical protein
MRVEAQQRHSSLQVRAVRVRRWVIDACIGMHVVVADTDDVTSTCNVGSLLPFLLAVDQGREGDPCMCCARTAASSLASLSTSFFGTPSAVVEAPAALEGALNEAMVAKLGCDQQRASFVTIRGRDPHKVSCLPLLHKVEPPSASACACLCSRVRTRV